MKVDKKTRHKKNVLINHIDVKYREIENFEYQYVVLKSILNNFNEKQLQIILDGTKKIKELDQKEIEQQL